MAENYFTSTDNQSNRTSQEKKVPIGDFEQGRSLDCCALSIFKSLSITNGKTILNKMFLMNKNGNYPGKDDKGDYIIYFPGEKSGKTHRVQKKRIHKAEEMRLCSGGDDNVAALEQAFRESLIENKNLLSKEKSPDPLQNPLKCQETMEFLTGHIVDSISIENKKDLDKQIEEYRNKCLNDIKNIQSDQNLDWNEKEARLDHLNKKLDMSSEYANYQNYFLKRKNLINEKLDSIMMNPQKSVNIVHFNNAMEPKPDEFPHLPSGMTSLIKLKELEKKYPEEHRKKVCCIQNDHAYTITSVNKNDLTLCNPYDSSIQIHMSRDEFFNHCPEMFTVDVD